MVKITRLIEGYNFIYKDKGIIYVLPLESLIKGKFIPL
jgi:hypothetical protein